MQERWCCSPIGRDRRPTDAASLAPCLASVPAPVWAAPRPSITLWDELSRLETVLTADDKKKRQAEQRRQRQIDKHRENEARWLQKVLFALGKAREARSKLSEATGDDLNPLVTLDDGSKLPLDTLEEMINKRVDDLMEALGRKSYGLGR